MIWRRVLLQRMTILFVIEKKMFVSCNIIVLKSQTWHRSSEDINVFFAAKKFEFIKCSLHSSTQPKFTPWSPNFNKTVLNVCVVIDTSEGLTGFWNNENCDKVNKYICERPQIPTGQIAELYLPRKNEGNVIKQR